MDVVLAGVVGTVCAYGARLLHLWIVGRTRVELTRVAQQGISERVRHLPPGSRVRLRRAGEPEVVLEIGDRPHQGIVGRAQGGEVGG
ncbi:hypothetical protein [Streptomyces sp. MST-110588]|uniref:hypothetical protein n=1 Tax=Streptomyces sp. MST-110588 TaxID=2833628 RepID=UPI001F5CD906|nr:hypothetical protein [Streptomyces sp. MST-110588]UNO38579.1 hypothetical protein KGS77_01605 [Streptomyces sp. MST-110588]